MNPGIHRLTLSEYLAAEGVSKHGLDWFAKSPAHYRDYRAGLIGEEQTEAMKFGSLLHALVFEGRRDYAVRPATYPSDKGDKPWHGGAAYCKQWEADQIHPVIWAEDEKLLEVSASAVQAHPLAAELLKAGDAEVSMFAVDPDTGLLIKCRADWLFNKAIADLKSTTDASTRSFSREIFTRRYHVQAAINLYIAELLEIDAPSFYFLILEKGDVPRVNIRLLKSDAVSLGRMELKRDLAALSECMAEDHWPGYCGDTIELIDVPAWAYSTQNIELQIGGQIVTL